MDLSIKRLATVTVVTILQYLPHILGESVSVCFSSNQRSLPISCGSGHMLRITNAFYGHSYSGACSFRPGDCVQREHEAYPCTGRDSCNINLPSGPYGKHLAACNKDSTYFQVEYSCEPVTQTADICGTSQLTAQRGFLSTPRYPNNYRDNLECVTRITVHPSQKVNLTIIDMDLDRNGSIGCNDWMYAYNLERSVTLCGRRSHEKLTTLMSSEINVMFKSDQQTNKKGFWIYYEAYPPLPTTAAPVTQAPQVTTETRRPIQPPQVPDTSPGTPRPAPAAQSSGEEKEKLPFVAIVSGVIGTLTFILIVLLMLLVYRWWHDKQVPPYKHKPHDVEYLDARNPAFRSSTGTEFGNIEIYYNC